MRKPRNVFCEAGKVRGKKPFDENELLRLITLLEKSGTPLSAGNCGQVAIALGKYIIENYQVNPKDITIGMATSDLVSETYEDLVHEEFYLYHAYIEYKGNKFDETGKIDTPYLVKLATEQYNNPTPMVLDGMPINETVRRIISGNTAWKNNWTYFYKLLQQNNP
jgi:hypothetical protein